MSTIRIADIGLMEAAKRLIPITVAAGSAAMVIQDVLMAGRVQNTFSKEEEDGYNKQALTDADILCSNMIGAAALAQFSDLSYLSEEAKADNVSKYFLHGQPYVLVFDPINGTSYFKDGKRCYENIYTIADAGYADASHTLVKNTQRAVVINMPRQQMVYVGDGITTLRADTTRLCFDGRGDIDLLPHHVPQTARGGVYVSVSLKDQLEAIRSCGLDACVAHHAYQAYGYKDPDWDFVPSGILDGRVSAFAIAGIDLMDSLAVAYLAQGAGIHVLIEGYDPATHIARLAIAAIDKREFDILCDILAPIRSTV